MEDAPDILNPSTKTLAWISGIIALLLAANNGVSVPMWVPESWGYLGALTVGLFRYLLIAGPVTFVILYIVR
jgi:hypothetical protein